MHEPPGSSVLPSPSKKPSMSSAPGQTVPKQLHTECVETGFALPLVVMMSWSEAIGQADHNLASGKAF